MAQIVIEPVGEAEKKALNGWLEDAASWNIDLTDIATVDTAYERYLAYVLEQDESERQDPTAVMAMIGFALGQWLNNTTILEWRVITDDEGRDLGLALPDESSFMFPSDFVSDAWNEGRSGWLADWARDLRQQLEALR